MQRFRPKYYEKFICTADRCPRTCCQEWKIPVDEATEERWNRLAPPRSVKLQRESLSAYIIEKEETRVIGLKKDHRCPFLTENRLCALVSTYGDQVLSETCTDFPREVHVFSDHEEETLMPCCPAVIDIWEKEEPGFPAVPGEEDNLLLLLRREIMNLLADEKNSPEEALLAAFYILLDLNRRKKPALADVKDCFSGETKDELLKAIRKVPLPLEDTVLECGEILQDLSVNYRNEGLYNDFLDPVLKVSEAISEGELDEDLEEKWKNFLQEWKKWERLIRKFLMNEIFSDLVAADSDLESLLLRMEWIALEYAGIRQSAFVRWILEGEHVLAYETLREAIVVLTRMTGYEEEDIREYLENSFESPVWEWGYFALVLSLGRIQIEGVKNGD